MSRSRLRLSIALSDNENTRPLIDGLIQPEGIELMPTTVHPSEMFWRQLKFAEFDASEMSMSSLTIATSQAPTPWVALPVFTTRSFFHTRAMVRVDAGINAPADLKGKRVGVPEYQQTAAIWSRGVLQHEFGVKPSDIEWFMERPPEKSHGGSTGFAPPPGVKLNYIPPTTNIGEMLLKGELDATILYLSGTNLVDRSRADLASSPKVRTLFPDPAAEGQRYFAKTGIYPINHGVVIRRSLLDNHPWLALNLFAAFRAARAEGATRGQQYLRSYFEVGTLGEDVKGTLATDPMAYGVKAARPVLETITQYVHEQGLTKRRVGLEEIFAPSAMDL